MKMTREGVYKIKVFDGSVNEYPIVFMDGQYGSYFETTKVFIPQSIWVDCEVIERVGDIK